MSDTKEHLAGLAINIPHAMIEDQIRATMIAMMPNPEVWVSEIIKLALQESTGNYRDKRETVFSKACSNMIRDQAESIFKEWVAEHRELIKEALVKEMQRTKGKRIVALAKHIADGLAKTYVSGVTLKIGEEE